QLLEEQARRHAHLAAELPCHGLRQGFDVPVRDHGAQPGFLGLPVGKEVPHPTPHGQQCAGVERRQTDLGRTRVIEAPIGGEVRVQALGQRGQALDTLWPVKEGRRPGGDQVQ
ncbi:hypothetical protein RZS08_59365, partial [Arthrospira platensis SPKY1]|nr:hypothetical protein [Arthrospira platensis SPKY1]